jgi:hypothetical protein
MAGDPVTLDFGTATVATSVPKGVNTALAWVRTPLIPGLEAKSSAIILEPMTSNSRYQIFSSWSDTVVHEHQSI